MRLATQMLIPLDPTLFFSPSWRNIFQYSIVTFHRSMYLKLGSWKIIWEKSGANCGRANYLVRRVYYPKAHELKWQSENFLETAAPSPKAFAFIIPEWARVNLHILRSICTLWLWAPPPPAAQIPYKLKAAVNAGEKVADWRGNQLCAYP